MNWKGLYCLYKYTGLTERSQSGGSEMYMTVKHIMLFNYLKKT